MKSLQDIVKEFEDIAEKSPHIKPIALREWVITRITYLVDEAVEAVEKREMTSSFAGDSSLREAAEIGYRRAQLDTISILKDITNNKG